MQTHAKLYNRNLDADSFEKWLRQQTGIWPHARRDNLLYTNKSDVDPLLRKSGCVFALVDTPRLDASQPLHNASRSLERAMRRGAKFVAIDAAENPALAKKVLGTQQYGAFLWAKASASAKADWVQYTGPPDSDAIREFLNSKKCGVVMATPSPTPEPLPELPDFEDFAADQDDDEPTPAERAAVFRKEKEEPKEEGKKKGEKKPKKKKPVVEKDGDDDVSEWSDNDENL
jgi:hypothetical protein